ncbi:hypothetical protein SISNIDRAFT_486853 [Sistotremastrum niveocremeum HHB9708]|uniref:F-box domain-containing protein n=1 Tax=Sistotremastrum niveocremeum HHB9708 TaxID=1314777 RepID=A0A164SY82_9AGAM|nr:hypothetical protein SISNIDRAFT_486853 [Sistotremastrum niveocremeum HHB9708]
MPRKFLNLPPELISKSLEGLSVEDIICVAQTCSLLRAVVLSNKFTLLDTNDSNILELPFNRPLKHLSSELLHTRAVESIKATERLNASPLCHKGFFYLPLADLEVAYDNTNAPTDFFVHGNIHAFRSLNTLHVMELSENGVKINAVSFALAEVNGNMKTHHHISYQLSNDQGLLRIASHSYRDAEKASVLQVREVRISSQSFGETTYLFRLDIPGTSEPLSVTIRDPYVSVMTRHNCILVNWRKTTGIILVFRNPEEDEDFARLRRKHTLHWQSNLHGVRTLIFHPIESSMILVSTACDGASPSGIYSADIPSYMPPINPHISSDKSTWTNRVITPRELPTYTVDPEEDHFSVDIEPIGFKQLPDSSWVFEIIVYGPVIDAADDPEEENLESKAIVGRVLFDPRSWTQETELLEHKFTGPAEALWAMGTSRNGPNGGTLFFISLDLLPEPKICQVMVPELGNGSGFNIGWVELDISGFIGNNKLISEATLERHWANIFQAFDSKSRYLYLCVPDSGILVIQL